MVKINLNQIVILFRGKKEQSFMGIDEVILDGKSISPSLITATDIKESSSMNLKGEGQNVAIQSSDILSFHYLGD